MLAIGQRHKGYTVMGIKSIIHGRLFPNTDVVQVAALKGKRGAERYAYVLQSGHVSIIGEYGYFEGEGIIDGRDDVKVEAADAAAKIGEAITELTGSTVEDPVIENGNFVFTTVTWQSASKFMRLFRDNTDVKIESINKGVSLHGGGYRISVYLSDIKLKLAA